MTVHLIATDGSLIVTDRLVLSMYQTLVIVEVELTNGHGVDVHPIESCESLACDGPKKSTEGERA